MLFLLDFSPIKPDLGLILWTTLIFILFWVIIGKLAFGPIKDALKKRETDIQNALDQARKAREEMANLKAENEELLAQAREERAKILKEAKEAKERIIAEAKLKAKEEAKKIVSDAKEQIENQKMAAMVEIKNTVGNMALEIAEKVLRKQLQGNAEQEQFVKTLVDDIKLN
ncbi:MAG: ATP synthase F0 subunit B [Bacteroidetes bacterium]|nr:MAG: ATP synthase F0 subunit B [Bacteroidota bacterium]